MKNEQGDLGLPHAFLRTRDVLGPQTNAGDP